MTENLISKNEKETRKREEAEAKSLLIKAGLSQEKQIIEKEVIKEVIKDNPKLSEKIKELQDENMNHLKNLDNFIKDNERLNKEIINLQASLKDDSKVIADLKAKLEESKKAIAKFENLKKLLDSAN